MKTLLRVGTLLCSLLASSAFALTDDNSNDGYLSLTVENVVVNTADLVRASETLAGSVRQLSEAIENLASSESVIAPQDRQTLLNTIRSVDDASKAIAKLALEIPRTADKFTTQLPAAIKDMQTPIADISSSLASTRESITTISQALPQATENARDLVNATLNSMLIRISIFTFFLVSILVIATVLAVTFIYKKYINPLMIRLEKLTGTPIHLENLSRYMKETSDNLLVLQNAGTENPVTDKPTS